jgi:hypothetical protein
MGLRKNIFPFNTIDSQFLFLLQTVQVKERGAIPRKP